MHISFVHMLVLLRTKSLEADLMGQRCGYLIFDSYYETEDINLHSFLFLLYLCIPRGFLIFEVQQKYSPFHVQLYPTASH